MGINRKNEIDFKYGPLTGIKSDGSRVVILSEDMLGDDLQLDSKGKLTLNAEKAIEKLSLVNTPTDGAGLGNLFYEYKTTSNSPTNPDNVIYTDPKDLDLGISVWVDSLLTKPVEDGDYEIWKDADGTYKVYMKVIGGVIDTIMV